MIGKKHFCKVSKYTHNKIKRWDAPLNALIIKKNSRLPNKYLAFIDLEISIPKSYWRCKKTAELFALVPVIKEMSLVLFKTADFVNSEIKSRESIMTHIQYKSTLKKQSRDKIIAEFRSVQVRFKPTFIAYNGIEHDFLILSSSLSLDEIITMNFYDPLPFVNNLRLKHKTNSNLFNQFCTWNRLIKENLLQNSHTSFADCLMLVGWFRQLVIMNLLPLNICFQGDVLLRCYSLKK